MLLSVSHALHIGSVMFKGSRLCAGASAGPVQCTLSFEDRDSLLAISKDGAHLQTMRNSLIHIWKLAAACIIKTELGTQMLR